MSVKLDTVISQYPTHKHLELTMKPFDERLYRVESGIDAMRKERIEEQLEKRRESNHIRNALLAAGASAFFSFVILLVTIVLDTK